MDSPEAFLQQLAREHVERGDPLGWFDRLYAAAEGDPRRVPWAQLAPRPQFVEWAQRTALRGDGRRALLIGCGLGDDAVECARLGFRVRAFDISPVAIDWCRRRFPEQAGLFEVGDLFHPPADWAAAFDFVLEAHTVQALPRDLHRRAMEAIAEFLAPGGTLFVLARGRDAADPAVGPPWLLTRDDLAAYPAVGLTEVSFEDWTDSGIPPARRFRVIYRR